MYTAQFFVKILVIPVKVTNSTATSWSVCDADGSSCCGCGSVAGLLKGRAFVNQLAGIISRESGQSPDLLKPLVKCCGRNNRSPTFASSYGNSCFVTVDAQVAIWCSFKVGQPWITNLRVMRTYRWVMSNCSQDSQNVCTKLFLYLIMPKNSIFLLPQLSLVWPLHQHIHKSSKNFTYGLSRDDFNSNLQAKTHIWPQKQ